MQRACPATFRAVGVLQTEAGLMALSHPGPVQGEQVVVGEHLDAVVVPGRGRNEAFSKGPTFNRTHLH